MRVNVVCSECTGILRNGHYEVRSSQPLPTQPHPEPPSSGPLPTQVTPAMQPSGASIPSIPQAESCSYCLCPEPSIRDPSTMDKEGPNSAAVPPQCPDCQKLVLGLGGKQVPQKGVCTCPSPLLQTNPSGDIVQHKHCNKCHAPFPTCTRDALLKQHKKSLSPVHTKDTWPTPATHPGQMVPYHPGDKWSHTGAER